MTHRQAVAAMLVATMMWSIAGVVSRHLQAAQGFEVTFWRSAFNALALVIGLGVMRGRGLWRTLRTGGWPLWVSGLCWATMYTAFMMALSFTSVANVLVTMSIAPLLAALFSRVLLRHRLPLRTWVAIGVAGCGHRLDVRPRAGRRFRLAAGHAGRRCWCRWRGPPTGR